LETRIVIALIEKALQEIDSSNPEALGIIVAYKNHTEEIKKLSSNTFERTLGISQLARLRAFHLDWMM